MGKFNNHKSKQSSKSRQMFFDTIQDIRKLVQANTNTYTQNTLGLTKSTTTKTKIPYNHLIGRRNAIKQKYKQQKSRAHEQNIQYDTNMTLYNSNAMKMQRNKEREKDQFLRNKYKYVGTQGGRIGRENDGFLEISKRDINRIYGKDGDGRKEGGDRGGGNGRSVGGQNDMFNFKKFKNKKGRGGKGKGKGGKGGKKIFKKNKN